MTAVNLGQVFYKYRSDSPFTEEIINSGNVFLATAHQLNDPFECSLQDISQDWLDGHLKEQMQASISGFLMSAFQAKRERHDFFGTPPGEIDAALKAALASDDLEAKYDGIHDFVKAAQGRPLSDCRLLYRKIDNQLTKIGIFSMSAEPVQALMWAHYGQDHRGLNLGFRATIGSKLANPEHCLPVVYSDDLPTVPSTGLQTVMSFAADELGRLYTASVKVAFSDPTLQRVVTTKPTDWAYEQEYRYIEGFGGTVPWPGELAECTFGLRCPDERRRHYIELLRKNVSNNVDLFEVRRREGSNALERVPFDPPVIRGRKRTKTKRPPKKRMLTNKDFFAKMDQLLAQEQFGEIILQVEDNLKRRPDDPTLHLYRASAYGHTGDHEKALKIFTQLSEKEPEIADVWYGMGVAQQQLGRDDAVWSFERAYQLEPNDPSHALNLGSHLIQIPDRFHEGLACLKHADRLGHRRARRLINEAEEAWRMAGGDQSLSGLVT